MNADLLRALLISAAWIALSIGADLVLRATLPGIDPRWASLWIVLLLAVLAAGGVSAMGWWHQVGYTAIGDWRNRGWLALAAALTLLPLAAGIRPLDAPTYGLLVAGYALTGFAEETVFRGVLVKLLERRSPIGIASLTAILFGLVHLSNIVIRGEVAVIAAQAVGAAAFGFGYVALRLRTNALLPLVITHLLTDLFLQMGRLPLIPVAVGQDVILFGVGVYLLRGWTRPAAGGT